MVINREDCPVAKTHCTCCSPERGSVQDHNIEANCKGISLSFARGLLSIASAASGDPSAFTLPHIVASIWWKDSICMPVVEGEAGKCNTCTQIPLGSIEMDILKLVCTSSCVSKNTYIVLSTKWMHKIKVWFIQQYYCSQHIYSIKNSAHTYISVNNMKLLHNLSSSLITITESDHYLSGTGLW